MSCIQRHVYYVNIPRYTYNVERRIRIHHSSDLKSGKGGGGGGGWGGGGGRGGARGDKGAGAAGRGGLHGRREGGRRLVHRADTRGE
eukprot:COSAG06_NODE_2709_length_6406_cov_86.599968_6_plen_86_part_01